MILNLPTDQRIIVIGAGIGGLTAAALLAKAGYEVLVLERAAAPGGKMRQVEIGDMRIDGGPTVLTMRWVFEDIFAQAGSSLGSHLKLERADILARHAWNGEQRLDLFADLQRSADAIGDFSGAAAARGFLAFSAESRRIYETLKRPFLLSQRPNPFSLVRRSGVSGFADLMRINPFESLWTALGRHFTDTRLRQLFARYSTYCGSSPFEAPATLMLVAHVEQDGVWMIEGGVYALASALARLGGDHGAAFRYHAEVSEIAVTGGRIAGVRLKSGEFIAAKCVIANADANAIACGLFGSAVAMAVPSMPAAARSLSAITWAMHAKTSGFALTRHNVFFSSDYRAEFRDIETAVASEPTVYVCAQDRDGAVPAAERLLCLINAKAGLNQEDIDLPKIEAAVRARLMRCGLEIDWKAENNVVTTPADFAGLFPATGGALYGRATHGWLAAFQRPRARTKLPGLYLAGGSVHPGPGVPMAALSGRLAVENFLADRLLM